MDSQGYIHKLEEGEPCPAGSWLLTAHEANELAKLPRRKRHARLAAIRAKIQAKADRSALRNTVQSRLGSSAGQRRRAAREAGKGEVANG